MVFVAKHFNRLANVLAVAAGIGLLMQQICYAQIMHDELAAIFSEDVQPFLTPPFEEQLLYADFAIKALKALSVIGQPQYVLLVDRSEYVQAIFIFWIEPGKAPALIGVSLVSTGKVGQFDYFETPIGVFEHSIKNPDFRAEGTRNALGIRGYGVKNMRVFDFGWRQATRGWGGGGLGTMRLQMHATDPDLLEPRLGTRQSKGCIRISASLNHWLDTFGIIDAEYADAVVKGKKLPVPMPMPKVYGPGRYLIVVDSERTRRPQWATPIRRMK